MAKKPTYEELAQRVKELEKNAPERRQWEEEKYNQLFTTVSDPIMIFDANTRDFLDVNNAAVKLYGCTKEEFLNLNHKDITAEEKKSAAVIKQTLNGHVARIPLRYHKKKDGTIFPVEISIGKFTLGERQLLCGVVRDITERQQVEQALQRERDKLADALAEVKTLSGMLPICSHCKNIRDDKGYWSKIEAYIGEKTGADFSHGVCPECADKYYPEYDLYGKDAD